MLSESLFTIPGFSCVSLTCLTDAPRLAVRTQRAACSGEACAVRAPTASPYHVDQQGSDAVLCNRSSCGWSSLLLHARSFFCVQLAPTTRMLGCRTGWSLRRSSMPSGAAMVQVSRCVSGRLLSSTPLASSPVLCNLATGVPFPAPQTTSYFHPH